MECFYSILNRLLQSHYHGPIKTINVGDREHRNVSCKNVSFTDISEWIIIIIIIWVSGRRVRTRWLSQSNTPDRLRPRREAGWGRICLISSLIWSKMSCWRTEETNDPHKAAEISIPSHTFNVRRRGDESRVEPRLKRSTLCGVMNQKPQMWRSLCFRLKMNY